jgi:hypothetical protein
MHSYRYWCLILKVLIVQVSCTARLISYKQWWYWYLDVCSMLDILHFFLHIFWQCANLVIIWVGLVRHDGGRQCYWCRLGLQVGPRASHVVVGSGLPLRRSRWRCCPVSRAGTGGGWWQKGEEGDGLPPRSLTSSREMPFSPKMPPHKVLFPCSPVVIVSTWPALVVHIH